MNAIVQTTYGLRGLRIVDVPNPVPKDNQVLVRVRAAALNYAVMIRVTGRPILARLIATTIGGVRPARGEAARRDPLFRPGGDW